MQTPSPGLDLITEERVARATRRKRHTLFRVESTR